MVLLAIASVVATVVGGLVLLVQLHVDVPLTDEDVKYASWLGSPSTALHFTDSLVGNIFQAAIILAGALLSFRRESLNIFIAALLLVFTLQIAGTERAYVRVGIYTGVVKIGCYVPEAKECQRMLGLPQHGASRYAVGDKDADWYAIALKDSLAASKTPSHWDIALASLPLSPLLTVWKPGLDRKAVNKMVEEQRAELQLLREEQGSRS